MAICGYIRRKIYRLFNVRSALVGVPLVWLLFIWWTIYYTQSMEKVQSKRQVIMSAEQQNHIEADEENNLVLIKNNETHASFSQRLTAKVKKTKNILRRENKNKLRGDKALTFSPNNSRRSNAPVDNNGGDGNAENGQKVFDDQDFSVLVTETSRKKFSQPPLHSMSAESGYFEFVPKEGKSRSTKISITPGSRFDRPKLGEFGTGVEIMPNDLNKSERAKYDEGWENFKFNEYASLQISTQRETPDYRPYECKKADQISNLPKVSIIICFYNEAWSVLLRTIYSVLARSPPEFITEIILVDDHSNLAMMGEPLENYVTQVAKLRLLRMTNRSGLVKARLAGVKEAKAPILIFLDSHVECAEGWLPPLLQSVLQNPNYAVTPEIDVIDHKTFAIQPAVDNIGVFLFEGFQFDWSSIMPRIKKSRKSLADPFKSPAMAGGLFAIRKDYFLSIGTYDAGLELWGGENIEISLKLWMCGGGILIHPCSRVAHIFRDESPYLVNNEKNIGFKNSARVAQVWIDEYRDLFFREVPYDEDRFGSVQERMELRERLQCHSFSWYLENVYPEMYIAGAGHYLGKVRSMTGLCIHPATNSSDSLLNLANCRKAHVLESTRIKEIRTSKMCMDTLFETSYLVLNTCDLKSETQTFEYTENKSIRHVLSNSCLTASSHDTSLTLKPCSGENLQTWFWPENVVFFPSS